MLTKQEKQELINDWFDKYEGPAWFIDYLLDGESDYTCFGHTTKEQNLVCAIYNKINTYSWNNCDAKHQAKHFVYTRICKIKTDAQCKTFIRHWIDSAFKL